jgi:hypothetical protein
MKETDWWWIDYMEDELDPTTEPDLAYLLENSQTDRDEFESWRLLKSWVKEVDPAKSKEELWSADQLSELKKKTLKALESDRVSESTKVSVRLF